MTTLVQTMTSGKRFNRFSSLSSTNTRLYAPIRHQTGPRNHLSTAVTNESGRLLNPRPPTFYESGHLCAFNNAMICGPADSNLKSGGCSVTGRRAIG